jgi:hypothetical protein
MRHPNERDNYLDAHRPEEQRVLTALQRAGRATADDRIEEAFLLCLIFA